jgi:hypothetical protein
MQTGPGSRSSKADEQAQAARSGCPGQVGVFPAAKRADWLPDGAGHRARATQEDEPLPDRF